MSNENKGIVSDEVKTVATLSTLGGAIVGIGTTVAGAPLLPSVAGGMLIFGGIGIVYNAVKDDKAKDDK